MKVLLFTGALAAGCVPADPGSPQQQFGGADTTSMPLGNCNAYQECKDGEVCLAAPGVKGRTCQPAASCLTAAPGDRPANVCTKDEAKCTGERDVMRCEHRDENGGTGCYYWPSKPQTCDTGQDCFADGKAATCAPTCTANADCKSGEVCQIALAHGALVCGPKQPGFCF